MNEDDASEGIKPNSIEINQKKLAGIRERNWKT